MEILDRVYKTFSNLDRDFAKSNKTRLEFITGKFGGDIQIGSMIILDAVSADTDSNSPEDVHKLTFIKDMVSRIKASGSAIDAVSSFRSLEDSSDIDNFLGVLESAMCTGVHVRAVSQQQLVRSTKEAVHIQVTSDGSTFCPIDDSAVLYPYNRNMMDSLASRFRFEGTPTLCQYYQVLNRQSARLVTPDDVVAILNVNGKASK